MRKKKHLLYPAPKQVTKEKSENCKRPRRVAPGAGSAHQFSLFYLVLTEGLEPPHLSALASKASVSTNSTM